jgi:hypothetical protein
MKILNYSLYDASICKEMNVVAFSEVIDPIHRHGAKRKCEISLYRGTSFFIPKSEPFKTIVSEVIYTAGVSGIGFNSHEVRSRCIQALGRNHN